MLVAVTYTAAAKLGLALAFVNASATAVWPPTGIALAAVLILGRRRAWPGILAGAFLANETTAGSLTTSLAIAAGNTGEALVGASLVNRFAGGGAAFDRAKHLVLFVLLAGLVSTTVSATIGVTSLAFTGFASWPDYGRIWLTWWLGDAAGAIVVAPVLLLWRANPRVTWSRTQRVEVVLLLLALIVVGWVVFVEVTNPLEFLCLPLCVWAGFRFGQREAATATCLLSVIAVWGTAHGLGSFGRQSPNDALLLLQVFMAVTTIVGITVGAAVAERRRADDHVRQLNDDLERRVRTRTAELQSAHDELRASEARLEEAQAVAHIGSWEWQISLNRVWWSKELYQIFGVDSSACLPSYAAFLLAVHPDDRTMVSRVVQQALTDWQPFECEHRITRPDGDVRTLYAKGQMVQGESGRSPRMLGIAQDITQQKRLEAQLLQAQKREALGRLIGGVAHDFNNLLTVITGYTDSVLQDVEQTNPQRADLLEVRKAAERAAALTRQLLVFSRRQVLEPQVINPNVVIEAISGMLRRLIGDNIVVTTALASDLHGVKVDAGHFEQILVNLAVNARDAMPNGGTLMLETTNVVIDGWYGFSKPAHPPVGPYVLLAVSDSGCGIDDQVKAHIFEPFFTTKEPGQGTGLGLATVYSIVKRSDGYVWVYSEPNRGTTFKLYFPAAGISVPLPLAMAEHVATDVLTGAETVFLVEDDEDVLRVARAALRTHGYRVLDARSGDEARRLATGYPHRIDLVVTDVVMPGLDGPGLVEQLRVTRPKLKALLISGYSKRAIMQHGLVPPGTPFLEKPFTPAQLLHTVRALLDEPVGVPEPGLPRAR